MMDNNIKQAINSNLSAVHVTQRHVNQIMNRISEGKKVKKKLSVALIFALILLLAAITAFAASVVSGYIKLNTNGTPTSAATVDDTVYMMTNQGLLSWSGTEEDAKTEMSAQVLQKFGISIDSLLFDAEGLMLLDTDHEIIWAYNNGSPQPALEYHETGVDFGDDYIRSVIQQDGVLFLLGEHEIDTTLYRWDLAGNTLEPLEIQGIISIVAYKTGALLAVQRDYGAQDRVVAIDTQNGDVSTLATLPLLSASGVAYSRKLDAIYAMVDGSLQCFTGGEWQVVRERSIPANSFFFAVLDNGYVAVGPGGAQYVTFDGTESGNQIHIAGYTSTTNISYNIDNNFEATHLGTTVIRQTSPHYCSVEIQEAIQAGETVDLFHVKLDAGVLSLIESGTLAAMDADAALTETCSAMLSQITDAIFEQGTLYAVPSEMTVYDWQASNPANATEVTFGDLLAANAVMENASTDTTWGQEDYVRYLLEQTIMAHSGTPDFASDEFLACLTQLKAANLRKWPLYSSGTDYAANVSYVMHGEGEETYPMLPPKVGADSSTQVPARLMVYVLNPNSQNKEAALAYLSYIAANYDETTAALLIPDQATSVLFPGFQQAIDEETAMDSPSSAARIADILNNPSFWRITEDALAYYRDVLSPHLNLQLEPLLADTHAWHDATFTEMVDAVLAYLDGEGTAEECAITLNDLARQDEASTKKW